MTRLPTPRMAKLELPKLVAVNDTFDALICRSDGVMTCRSCQIVAGERSHRNGNVLDALRDPLRGDDHLLDAFARGALVLGGNDAN